MLALIDADTIYFRAAASQDKSKREIRKKIDMKVREIEGYLLMPELLLAVKGRGNFRKDLYPEYKKNRKEHDEETKEALNYAHNYMIEKFGAKMADGMEADDLVCIWAYEAMAKEMPYTIVGIDKDLLQIPGTHLNFHHMEIKEVDDDTANYNLMLQCLTGDNSDNIPGIKGIGPKKAERILAGRNSPDTRWKRIRAAWRSHGAGNPELSYRLLKMITSWEELEDVKSQIQSQTTISEQDVQP